MRNATYKCGDCGATFTNAIAFLTHVCRKTKRLLVQGALVLRTL